MESTKHLYVITSPFYINTNVFKIGVHTGTENKLKSRYRTYFGTVIVLFFKECIQVDARKAESDILNLLSDFRVKNDGGNDSEMVKMNCDALLETVNGYFDAIIPEAVSCKLSEPESIVDVSTNRKPAVVSPKPKSNGNTMTCTKCGLEQLETEFRVVRTLKDGTKRRRRNCKTCEKYQKHEIYMKKKLERESVSNEIIMPSLKNVVQDLYLSYDDPEQLSTAKQLTEQIMYYLSCREVELMATPQNSFTVSYAIFDRKYLNLDKKTNMMECKSTLTQLLFDGLNHLVDNDIERIMVCERRIEFLVIIQGIELSDDHRDEISTFINSL